MDAEFREVTDGVDFYDIPAQYDHLFAHLNDAVDAIGPLTFLAQVEDLFCCSSKWRVLESLPSGYDCDPEEWPWFRLADGREAHVRCWVEFESEPYALVHAFLPEQIELAQFYLIPLAEVAKLEIME